VGNMLVSAPYNGASWLRMVAVADTHNVSLMLDALWIQMRLALADCATRKVGMLTTRSWIANYLPALGFHVSNQVITFERNGPYLPTPLRADLTIRAVKPEDLEAVRAVDGTAFAAMWQYGSRDLHDAYRIAAHFTVAEMNRRIVGYQISTVSHEGGHLVRLATAPRLQGMGVGSMLLGETIEYFLKHGQEHMTVNTQSDNFSSQQLYRRFGFEQVGKSVPVWMVTL